jgi:hypothetical protein
MGYNPITLNLTVDRKMTNSRDKDLADLKRRLEWSPSPKAEVSGLQLLASYKDEAGYRSYAAFEALSVILQAAEHHGEVSGNDRVEVPVWILESLVSGWRRYVEASGEKGNTIGKAMGLEGRGSRRIVTELDQLNRNLTLVVLVIDLLRSSEAEGTYISVEAAINLVAEKHNVTPDRLWQIYNEYKDFGERIHQAHVARTNEGSPKLP